jgi:hypothetical protein
MNVEQDFRARFKEACLKDDLFTVTYMLFHEPNAPKLYDLSPENNVMAYYILECYISQNGKESGLDIKTIESATKYNKIEFMLMAYELSHNRIYNNINNKICINGQLHLLRIHSALSITPLSIVYRLVYDTTMAGHMFIIYWLQKNGHLNSPHEILEAACYKNNGVLAAYALTLPIRQYEAAYHQACYNGNYDIVAMIHKHWIPNWRQLRWVNYVNKPYGNERYLDVRILYLAVTYGFTKLTLFSSARLLDYTSQLANVNFIHLNNVHCHMVY